MIVVSKATEADLSRATQQPHIRHYFNDQHIFNISSHLFSRASVLPYVFIFCSNFLRPALLLSCGRVAVVVVRFDQGDIDFYSLRALHYHFAQVQFAVRVPVRCIVVILLDDDDDHDINIVIAVIIIIADDAPLMQVAR